MRTKETSEFLQESLLTVQIRHLQFSVSRSGDGITRNGIADGGELFRRNGEIRDS